MSGDAAVFGAESRSAGAAVSGDWSAFVGEAAWGDGSSLRDEAALDARALWDEAAMLGGRSADGVPLRQLLPSVAATVPRDRLRVALSPWAARWPVHPQHTRQILINLVGNAARYTTGAIHVGARLRARRLRLTVADEGSGPNPDLVRALRRSLPPTDDKGLGLWLVRYLATLHGGRVRAGAVRTGGLIMEVLLPRYRP